MKHRFKVMPFFISIILYRPLRISEPKLYLSSYTDSPAVISYMRANPHDPSSLLRKTSMSDTHRTEDRTRAKPILRENAAAPSTSSSSPGFRMNFSRLGSRSTRSDQSKGRSKPMGKGRLVISQPLIPTAKFKEETEDASDITNRLSASPWTLYSFDTSSGDALPHISLPINKKVHLPSRVFDPHQIFGLHLEVLLERGHCDEDHLPKILKHCTDYLRGQIGAGHEYNINDYVTTDANQDGLRIAIESLGKGDLPRFDVEGSGVALARSRSRSHTRHPVSGITLANSLLIQFFAHLPNTLFPLNAQSVSIRENLENVNEIEFLVLVHLMDFLSFVKTTSPSISTEKIARLFGPLVSRYNNDITDFPYMHMQRLTDNFEHYRHTAVRLRNKRQIGVSLKNLKANGMMDLHDIPQILSKCVEYIQMHLMDVEGIFRTSAPKDDIQRDLLIINSGKNVDFSTKDQLLPASIVKRFCTDLPNNILPNDLLFVDKLEIHHIVLAMANLDDLELKVFNYLFTFFRALTEYKNNKMSSDAIGRSIPSIVHNIYLIQFDVTNHLSAVSASKLDIADNLKYQSDANTEAGNIVAFIITNYREILDTFCVTERGQQLLNCEQPNSALDTGVQYEVADTNSMRIRK